MREAILEGEIAPGAVMSQVALADELGVSRTPLREALRMLQSEGLVDAQAQPPRDGQADLGDRPRGARASCASRWRPRRSGCRWTALQPEDIAALEGRLAEMAHFAEAKDYARWTLPHNAFHRGLTAPAGDARQRAAAASSPTTSSATGACTSRARPKAWLTDRPPRDPRRRARRGDRELSAAPARRAPVARTAFDVMELLEPGYDGARLRQTLEDVGARPKRRRVELTTGRVRGRDGAYLGIPYAAPPSVRCVGAAGAGSTWAGELDARVRPARAAARAADLATSRWGPIAAGRRGLPVPERVDAAPATGRGRCSCA